MKKYCLNCMRETTAGTYCADCANLDIPQTAPHQLKPGTVLKEKYLIGTVIGEGGFGITYIGRDLVLDKKVAVKEFYPAGHINRNNEASVSLTISTEMQKELVRKGVNRFLEEARNVAQFSENPGIVDVKDFFEANETAYMVMEYLEGRTLASHMKEFGRMDADKVFDLMVPIMNALAKIHKLGVIHRDISPDNIMYLNKGTLKLMDFGAARCYMERNRELTSMIRRGYAPEEQYTGSSEQGPWTDVYGLCATIYKCITGVTPPDALERLSHDNLKRPSELGVRISPQLEELLMRGMALHANERCRSVEELLRVIQDSRSGEPEKDEEKDCTVFADRTFYTEESSRYNGLDGPEDCLEQGRSAVQPAKPGKKRFLIPGIAGCVFIIAAASALIWNLGHKGDTEEIETSGDYYVTGCKEVLKVREEEGKDSKVVTKLENGEKAALMERGEGNYWKVYIEAEDVMGYVDCHYLTENSEAVMEPVTRYVDAGKDAAVPILSTPGADGTSVGIVTRGDEVVVLADPGDTYAYIYAADKSAYGYVERSNLSEDKPTEEPADGAGSDTDDTGMHVEEALQEENDVKEPVSAAEDFKMNYLQEVYASSTLEPDSAGFTYYPGNVIDNNLSTGWVEGVSGQGEGEWIEFSFNGIYKVSGFAIYSGYHKNNETYLNNSRPKDIMIEFSDGTRQNYRLNDEMYEQSIALKAPVETNYVRITIISVYSGIKYDDTVISELAFY